MFFCIQCLSSIALPTIRLRGKLNIPNLSTYLPVSEHFLAFAVFFPQITDLSTCLCDVPICLFYALCQFSIFSFKNCLKSSIFRVTRIRPFTTDIAAICPSTKKRDRGMSIGNFLFSHCIGYPRTPTFVQHVHKIECCLFHSSYRIF